MILFWGLMTAVFGTLALDFSHEEEPNKDEDDWANWEGQKKEIQAPYEVPLITDDPDVQNDFIEWQRSGMPDVAPHQDLPPIVNDTTGENGLLLNQGAEATEEQDSSDSSTQLCDGVAIDSDDLQSVAPGYEEEDGGSGYPDQPPYSAVLAGTEANDVLSGINARLDVATGITTLNGISSELISAGGGDDEIGVGFSDSAIGGDGNDTFIVDGRASNHEAGLSPPKILDFCQGEDLVVISIPTEVEDLESTYPDRVVADFELAFEKGKDSTKVFVDGQLACELQGIYDLQPEDIKVKFDYHGSIMTDFELLYGA